MTSHDVVAVLRRITKIKQIGHTGTLDPFAEGVLPVCIGKATRLIEFLADDKEYLATVQFGSATTTYVIEGEEGKKLYEYARNGVEVEIKPRKVVIDKIELKSFNEQSQQAEILIKCSKGTYIRSIAHDLGQNLGVGAHLVKLVRTQAGKFRVEDSVQLEGINVDENLINPVEMLDLPMVEVNDEQLEKILHGMPINFSASRELAQSVVEIPPAPLYKGGNVDTNFVSLIYNNNVAAVGLVDRDKIKVKKVFL